MSELDDLPSWAGRSTEEVQLPVDPPGETPISDESAPEPPTLPTDPDPEAEPEIAAEPAADQAPPLPPEAPVDDPEVTDGAETPPVQPQDEPTVLAKPSITAPAAAAVGAAATQAPVMTEPVRAEPAVATRRASRLRPLLLGLLGLGILAGAAAIGYAFASRDSDATEATGTASTETAEDPAAPSTDAETNAETDAGTTGDDAADGESGETATDAGSETGDASDGSAEDGTETVTVEVDEDAEGNAEDDADAEGDADADAETDAASDGDGDATLNDGDRQAIFRGGKVYLSGAVPSEEIGAAIVAKAEAVVGPGNVVNEYTIDPSTTIVPGSSAPLYVEDVVLFEFNSIEVARPFLPILDLGTLLLRQNPQASVTVVTRTDAVGSEEVNLEVARRRAQAVINYWLGQGVNADQILADPRGEEGASEDDDAETAARQRRAEFIITGLLD